MKIDFLNSQKPLWPLLNGAFKGFQLPLDITVVRNIEYPISLQAEIRINVNELVSFSTFTNFQGVGLEWLPTSPERGVIHVNAELFFPLDDLALNVIEKARNIHNGDVIFSIKFHYPCMKLSVGRDYPQLTFEQKEMPQFRIPRSQWVDDYLNKFNTGRIMIIEFPRLDQSTENEYWSSILNSAFDYLEDMKEKIASNDWEKVVSKACSFLELFKFKDKEKAHKDELQKLFSSESNNSEIFANWHDSIQRFYDYLSKARHPKDKNGNLQELFQPKQEDAWMAYVMCLGFYNQLKAKIERME